MAGFTDTLRGEGLATAQKALAALQEDPLRLDRERQRFSHSPLPSPLNLSRTATRSASPVSLSEEKQRLQERRAQLGQERRASKPYQQFDQQVKEEEKRILKSNQIGIYRIPVGSDAYTIACGNIKKSWVDQGIWNNRWGKFASGRWKHEEPLEPDSELEIDIQAEPQSHSFGFTPTESQAAIATKKRSPFHVRKRLTSGPSIGPRVVQEQEIEATDAKANLQPSPSLFGTSRSSLLEASFTLLPQRIPKQTSLKSKDERPNIAERRIIREREREASRPYHQFIYQISKERERIISEFPHEEGANAADINTRAYENVKNIWTNRGIWSKRWGILPGMLWKHEEPLQEENSSGHTPEANPAESYNYQVGASPKRLFRYPSVVEPSHCQASGALQLSQQVPYQNFNATDLACNCAESSASKSNILLSSSGKEALPQTAPQPLSRKNKASYDDRQPANIPFGPVHSSRSSKTTGQGKMPPQLPKTPNEVSFRGLSSSSPRIDGAETGLSATCTTSHKRKRAQDPILSVTKRSRVSEQKKSTKPVRRSARIAEG